MRNNFIIVGVTLVAISLAVVLSSLYVGQEIADNSKDKTPSLVTKLVDIEGMTCQECEISIKEAGEKIDGITKVTASSVNEQAIVEFDSTKTDIETIMKAIRETGYRPQSSKDVPSDYTFQTPKAPPAMKCGAGKCGASMQE